MKLSLKSLVRAGVIASIYFVLSAFMQPISFGPLQLRLGESLAMLPFIMPEAIFGVTIGCLLSNMLFSPFALYDAIFGTLATLIAAIMTHKMKNVWLSALPPIIINALVIPLIWFGLGVNTAYLLNFAMMLGTQSAVMYLLGVPLVIGLKKAMPNEFLDKNSSNKCK